MSKQELMVTGVFDKYAHIFENLGKNVQTELKSVSYEEKHEEVLQARTNDLSDFFGFDIGSVENFTQSLMAEVGDELNDTYESSIVKQDKLDARTKEENEERFKESQFVFQRSVAEKQNLTEPEWSKSTDYVVEKDQPGYAQKMSNQSYKKMDYATKSGYGTDTKKGYQSGSSSSSWDKNKSAKTDEPTEATYAFGYMNNEVQNIATQRIPDWNRPSKEEASSHFEQYARNVPWWKKGIRKAKSFVKSKKGRITAKMAILIGMNMGMAVMSKRMKFENGQQMVGMFAFMITSFFITRELTEEGVNLNGFSF